MSTFREAHDAYIAVRDEAEPVCRYCEQTLERRGVSECETSAKQNDVEQAWCVDCCVAFCHECSECQSPACCERVA